MCKLGAVKAVEQSRHDLKRTHIVISIKVCPLEETVALFKLCEDFSQFEVVTDGTVRSKHQQVMRRIQ